MIAGKETCICTACCSSSNIELAQSGPEKGEIYYLLDLETDLGDPDIKKELTLVGWVCQMKYVDDGNLDVPRVREDWLFYTYER